MSTKKIRMVLERVKGHSPHAADVREAEEALAEVEAIERAAKALSEDGVGDFVYNIRDQHAEDPEWKGDRWEHPKVIAWSDASELMDAISRGAK